MFRGCISTSCEPCRPAYNCPQLSNHSVLHPRERHGAQSRAPSEAFRDCPSGKRPDWRVKRKGRKTGRTSSGQEEEQAQFRIREGAGGPSFPSGRSRNWSSDRHGKVNPAKGRSREGPQSCPWLFCSHTCPSSLLTFFAAHRIHRLRDVPKPIFAFEFRNSPQYPTYLRL